MEATISPRDGITQSALDHATHWHPLKAPDLWMTRDDAAAQIGVNPRTVDRYIRNHKLTAYQGPVGGNLYGVRVLKSEVDAWVEPTVKAVKTNG